MNKLVKRKWVRALRSGEYQQARGTLFKDEAGKVTHHCCLAVIMAEMHPSSYDGRSAYRYIDVGEDQVDGMVADDLATQWGLDQDSQDVLAKMNDDGSPFPDIADWIEENL